MEQREWSCAMDEMAVAGYACRRLEDNQSTNSLFFIQFSCRTINLQLIGVAELMKESS